MKVCKACGATKDASQFHRNARYRDGREARCADCMNAYYAERYEATKQRKLEQMRSYHERNATKIHQRKLTRYNAEKTRAHNAVKQALIVGSITKMPCLICGSDCVEAHHADYSRPLDVVWLCRTHHRQAHELIRVR